MAKPVWLTDHNVLSNIKTDIIQRRDGAKCELREIQAFDTETDRNGDIIVICDDSGNYLDEITPDSLFSWLFSRKNQGKWNFFFNLNFDASAILKTLGDTLYDYRRTRRLSWDFNDFTIQYIPFKKLTVMKGHKSAVFFDIMQFYQSSLIDAYKNNIGEISDQNYLDTKKKRDVFSREFYRKNRKLVRDYCIQDCVYTKTLAENWVNLFGNAFEFYPQRWISPAYLAEKILINHGIYIPRFEETPLEIQNLAWNTYRAGRFEILRRGFIGESHLYDINSAYPFALSHIPDITTGKWKKGLTKVHPDVLLGFFKIKAKVPDDKFVPPFWYVRNKRLMFPVGTFTTFATLEELKAVDPSYYEILESWQYLDRKPSYPYKDFIESVYEKRLKLKQEGNSMQLVLKVILNSIYGKTAQRIGHRIGNLFNPVICAQITGHTRAILYDFIMKNNLEDHVVSIATDSILTTKKINVNSSKLGQFKHEKSANDTYIIQNGINRMNNEWKNRGIFIKNGKRFEHLDTVIRDGTAYMIYQQHKPNTLRASIISGDISKIARFETFEKRIDLNADRKRDWVGQRLERIDDKTMHVSMPWNLDLL